eukprot:CAMPEP_0172187000 /NCGR_PEP_ID=MMETSP1050-20130122/21096_1 /TAXON_ID=233186 /ORGANISM="Cryptomonas curvata, Strain CCAP979/52" /LENGTH=156 /DNA_ID=CAMNT_0012861277 /DNA_START=197 /DNA_END=668 /DNA_ORIENTATION=+
MTGIFQWPYRQIRRVDRQLAILQPRAQGGDEHARITVHDLLHCRDLIARGLDHGATTLLAQCLCSPAKLPLRNRSSTAAPRHGHGSAPLKHAASQPPFAPEAAAAEAVAASATLVTLAGAAAEPEYPTAEAWGAPAAAGAFDIGADDPFRADWPHW